MLRERDPLRRGSNTRLPITTVGTKYTVLFSDDFNRANGAIGNNYTTANALSSGSVTSGIVSNVYRMTIFSPGSNTATFYQATDFAESPEYYIKYDYYIQQNGALNKLGRVDISLFTDPTSVTTTFISGYYNFVYFNTGISVKLELLNGRTSTIKSYKGSTELNSATILSVDSTWYTLEFKFVFSSATAGTIYYKNYLQGSSAATWTELGAFSGINVGTKKIAFNLHTISSEVNGFSYLSFDNYSIANLS
jgi:hypothetical protein